MENPTAVLVNSLSPRKYKGNTSIYTVKLSNSIKAIPRECFQGCINLKRIVIPRSVASIHFKAFANSGIEEVVFETGSCLRVLSARCFEKCPKLITITLPSTICIIGDYCFQDCLALRTKIFISTNIKEIGAYAYYRSGLNHFEIYASKRTSNERMRPESLIIGYKSFQSCHNLQSFSFPSHTSSIKPISSLTDPKNDDSNDTSTSTSTLAPPTLLPEDSLNIHISQDTFSNCENLKSITIPSTIMSIGKDVFAYSGIEKIEFSQDSQLEFIPYGMFSRCSMLNDVILPPSITSIRDFAFAGSKINDKVFTHIFESCLIKHIGEAAFSSTPALKSITIPSSVRSIGQRAFGYSYITSFILSQNSQLRTIPEYMFAYCPTLKLVTLSPSINSIGKDAFSHSSINVELFSQIFSNSKIQHIGEGAFADCKDLKSVTIPSSVISIDKRAFAGSNIDDIIFSSESQLQAIPDSMFLECVRLKTISLPSSMNLIGNSAFESSGIDDQAFRQIFENTTIQHIGEQAFANCKKIMNIELPSSIKSIGIAAFTNSSLITAKLSIDMQLEILPERLFTRCYRLYSVSLPSSVITLGQNSFEHTRICDLSFKNIFASGNIQHIGDYAFSKSEILNSVVIPSSVVSIGVCAFSSCETLERVEFCQLSRLEVISPSLFIYCEALKFVKLPPSVTTIEGGAFYQTRINNEVLATMFESCNIQYIGRKAFAGCDLELKKIKVPLFVKSIDEEAFVEKKKSSSRCIIN